MDNLRALFHAVRMSTRAPAIEHAPGRGRIHQRARVVRKIAITPIPSLNALCSEQLQNQSFNIQSFITMAHSTSFLRKFDVLKNCPDLLNHRITGFSLRDGSALLVNDHGKLLAFGRNKDGILGLGHSHPIEERLVEVEAMRSKKVRELVFEKLFVTVLTDDGQVWTWGTTNERFILGARDRAHPGVARLLCTDIATIMAGLKRTLALSKSGQLWTWGANFWGQLGIGTDTPSELTLLTSLQNETIIKIACGSYHSLALTRDGKLFAWGGNLFCQLGLPDFDWTSTPVQINSFVQDSPIKDVACGGNHSWVLLENGHIYATGDNSFGQLGRPGTVEEGFLPIQVPSDSKFVSIFCFDNFSAALDMAGRIHVCGLVNGTAQMTLMETSRTCFPEAFLYHYSENRTPNMLIENIEPNCSIHTKLSAYFNDSSTSDIEFIVDNRSIHAHRQFLSLVSSYFKSMFSANWEGGKSQMVINSHSYSVFFAYIRFLYTGHVCFECMTVSELVDLLDLATSFLEESLRIQCVDALQGKLCIEHAIPIFVAADRHELDELRNGAIQLIRCNVDAVCETQSFQTVKKAHLKKIFKLFK